MEQRAVAFNTASGAQPQPRTVFAAYFVAANYNTIIQPFDGLVNEERPELYQPFMAGAHLERMLMRDFPYLRRLKRAEGPRR